MLPNAESEITQKRNKGLNFFLEAEDYICQILKMHHWHMHREETALLIAYKFSFSNFSFVSNQLWKSKTWLGKTCSESKGLCLFVCLIVSFFLSPSHVKWKIYIFNPNFLQWLLTKFPVNKVFSSITFSKQKWVHRKSSNNVINTRCCFTNSTSKDSYRLRVGTVVTVTKMS